MKNIIQIITEGVTRKSQKAEERYKMLKDYPKDMWQTVENCINICYAGAWRWTEPKISEADFNNFWEDIKGLDVNKLEHNVNKTSEGIEYGHSLKAAFLLAMSLHKKDSKSTVLMLLENFKRLGNGDPYFISVATGNDRKYKYGSAVVIVMLCKGLAEYLGFNNWVSVMDMDYSDVKEKIAQKIH